MSEKADHVQKIPLKAPHKSWRTITQDHLKNTKQFCFMLAKYKDSRPG